MARYIPLFYRGSPASIPQVVAHIQRTLTEEDPDYTPLRQRMPPASIPDIVAHIQKYLTENVFVAVEDLGEDIAAYIEAHPDIVGVLTVNGSTGNVTLDASDIPIETGEDPTVAGAISYLSSQLALLVTDAVLSVNGLTPDDSHNVTLTGANITQDANTTKKLSETFGPASASTAGTKGLVPAPAAGDEDKVLSGGGTWVTPASGTVKQVCSVSPDAQGNVALTGSAVPTSTTDNTPISTTLGNLNDQKVNLESVAWPTITGTTNNTGSTIKKNTFFWLNGILYLTTANVADGATFTSNNCQQMNNGGLNQVNILSKYLSPGEYTNFMIGAWYSATVGYGLISLPAYFTNGSVVTLIQVFLEGKGNIPDCTYNIRDNTMRINIATTDKTPGTVFFGFVKFTLA